MVLNNLEWMGFALGFGLIGGVGYPTTVNAGKDKGKGTAKTTDRTEPEAKSAESQSVEPAVQSELERMETERQAALLEEAQSALQDTHTALAALEDGDTKAALAALAEATGKLDLVIARDPNLALAPVDLDTTVYDLYATPETVRDIVGEAKDDLSDDLVQDARHLLANLASEVDFDVTEIPLATYPAAIRAVTPLIDAGKVDEAIAALYAVLNTLVVETYIVPLPRIRAEAMIAAADQLATQKDRKPEDNTRLHDLIESTRRELQLAEALGYGAKDDYKPLYTQLDEIQKKTEKGQSGNGIFDKLRNSLKIFKFSR